MGLKIFMISKGEITHYHIYTYKFLFFAICEFPDIIIIKK